MLAMESPGALELVNEPRTLVIMACRATKPIRLCAGSIA